jgi:flagellin-specific chaperone FliS
MERGGEVAGNLARFYGLVRIGLVEAQVKQSTRILEQQISQLAIVHEAWLEVERATAAPISQSAGPASAGPSTPSRETPFANWSA